MSRESTAMADFRNNKYMEEKVNKFTDMINVMGFSEEQFCYFMTQEHKTLQQTFTRLCMEWLKTCASADYYYDQRNLASHELAKDIMKNKKETWFLPYI